MSAPRSRRVTIASPDVSSVAEELVQAYLDPASAEMQHIGVHEMPTLDGVDEILDLCRALMFPGYAGTEITRLERGQLSDLVRLRVEELRIALHRQVNRALYHREHQRSEAANAESSECTHEARRITTTFITQLPRLRSTIRLDLRAAFESDPAATGIDEILLTYPGAYAITVYRIAHALLRLGAPLVPRMMTEIAHRRTGIDIHPGAEIGERFFIDHGTGVVIGETSKIGAGVRIYQGVTLGALSIPVGEARPEAGARRHPTIEDDVVIYANATILGGNTIIGTGAIVGGNAFIVASVAPGAKVSGSSRARTVPGEPT